MIFADYFTVIHGHPPFPWQQMLADREEWPSAIDLPTASGKTACLDAAIYRLATGKPMPRRIWFIVDRRIVVDEAHERAQKIAKALVANPALAPIADALRRLGGTKYPLAVARLRGGTWRDDSGWARDPRQPAIICSTIDQLGSALLFRPYGHGLNTASIYAGLAANDSLIILDEAHCSEPFRQTLGAIQRFRGAPWCSEPMETPFKFTIMSATLSAKDEDESTPLDVFPADDEERAAALDHEELHRRTSAVKTATLKKVGNKTETTDPLVDAAVECAKHYREAGRQRIAIMVNRVNTAKEIHQKLGDTSDAEVVLLTGRLRPLDRDAIVAKYSPILKSGSTEPLPDNKPIILVTTQCLEVGADFSFHALVTECASLDALRQRFGRLNRLGMFENTDATILIREADTKVPDDKDDDPIYGKAIANTWAWLNSDEVSTCVTPAAEPAAKKKGKKAVADATSRSVDFGINSLSAKVNALRASDEGGTLFKRLLAPQLDAPILLPAHLDLLCQTSPAPAIEPEVSFFLHGKDRHAPEARVIFRLGLDLEDEDQVQESLRLLPPTSPESLSVPLYRLRQWLADHTAKDDSGDVEGEIVTDEERARPSPKFIIWKSKDDIRIKDNPGQIQPNSTVVLSADEQTLRAALTSLGQATDEAQSIDLAEKAQRMAKGRAALRINESNFDALKLGSLADPMRQLIQEGCEDRREWTAVLDDLKNSITERGKSEEACFSDKWLLKTLDCLTSGKRFRIFGIGAPIKEAVLIAIERTPPKEDELDEDERSTERTDKTQLEAISLAHHTEDVRRTARDFAKALPAKWASVVDRAAHAHDWGKADPRFQAMLHGGDETQVDPLHPLAKSSALNSKARSPGLPVGWEHAMLSVQIAQHIGYSQDDAELHLIASHHGSARPFAAIIDDPQATPIDLTFLDAGVITEEQRKALTPAHDLGSNIANRFWRLVRKHGWWGEAYLEAVFRLADWKASAEPSDRNEAELTPLAVVAGESPHPRTELLLQGIDGANPLGMLAALGVVRSLTLAWPDRDVRLHWVTSHGGRKAMLSFDALAMPGQFEDAVVEAIATRLQLGYAPDDSRAARLKLAQREFDAARKRVKDTEAAIKKRKLPPAQAKAARAQELEPLKAEVLALREPWLAELRLSVPSPELSLGKRVDVPAEEYRNVCAQCIASSDPSHALLAHFGSDGAMNGVVIEATQFSFINGSGHQFFLETARELITVVTSEKLRKALFELWQPLDEKYSMRWLPSEDRRYALMAVDPGGGSEKTLTVWAANLLGYVGLGLLPSAPTKHGLRTSGLDWGNGEPAFTWPLWSEPLTADSISALIAAKRDKQPVTTRWKATRIEVGDGANKKVNFTPAKAV